MWSLCLFMREFVVPIIWVMRLVIGWPHMKDAAGMSHVAGCDEWCEWHRRWVMRDEFFVCLLLLLLILGGGGGGVNHDCFDRGVPVSVLWVPIVADCWLLYGKWLEYLWRLTWMSVAAPLCVSLSACLSNCLPVSLPACLCACLSFCLSVCLSISLSIYFLWLSIYLSIYDANVIVHQCCEMIFFVCFLFWGGWGGGGEGVII